MSNTKIRIDAVPELAQAATLEAKTDLVNRLRLDAETIAVTKLERIERFEPEDEAPGYRAFGQTSPPAYRIFLLAKGTQYVYETRRGQTPQLIEEKFAHS